ncbi:hypothetical protein CC99x_005020 [Candidatus Berkiella cookevillensis]|uniref:Uncharacterized protein n=1 Tax=Candidatus Berkiella cookevillensis TaxID=437022 RepID=A0A0Q9YR37_9GAMM|nr:MTH938/NDUFAF3 family protein [Candidatus Berkiella cookevillensis]MCS5708261.1 hypothetical protein [Candidatus Berkiella cookevillensis]
MIIQQDDNSALFHIDKYQPGEIWINNQPYYHSVLIRPDALESPWPVASLDALDVSHFDALLNNPPDIFLLGTGKSLIQPSPRLLSVLYEKQIGVEVMDSLRAAYTFLILSSEARNVAAGIIII